MKKFLCAALLFTMIHTISIFAQAPVDLFDPFYEDLSIWEGCGLINDAPSIRPYPLQEIERLLQIVIEKGDADQRRKAAEYQARFFQRVFHFGGRAEVNFASRNSQKQFVISPLAKLNYSITKLLTISAYVSVNGLNKLDNENLLPAYSYSQKDIADDAGNIGKLKLLPMFNTSATFGTPEYYFTAGMGFPKGAPLPFFPPAAGNFPVVREYTVYISLRREPNAGICECAFTQCRRYRAGAFRENEPFGRLPF